MRALAACLVVGLVAAPALAQESGDPTRITPRPGRVALTFDDGPDPEWTPVILDLLDQYGVKATFFVLGTQVAEYPEIARDVVRRGHSLQNHGYRHYLLTTLGDLEARREIVRGAEIITRHTGVTPTCFRPPYGQFDGRIPALAAEAGQTIVLWSVDSADYYYQTTGGVINETVGGLHDGAVILMHDTLGGVLSEALPVIIEAVRAAGLEFDTLCDESVVGRPLRPHGRWGRFHRSVE